MKENIMRVILAITFALTCWMSLSGCAQRSLSEQEARAIEIIGPMLYAEELKGVFELVKIMEPIPGMIARRVIVKRQEDNMYFSAIIMDNPGDLFLVKKGHPLKLILVEFRSSLSGITTFFVAKRIV